MKKIIAMLLAMTLMLSVCGMLFSCGGDEPKPDPQPAPPAHTHTFDQKIISDSYLVSAATETSAAIYYYACACGEKGTQTFSHGERLKTELELVMEAINSTAPTSVTTLITTVNSGVTLTARTTLNETANTVEYQVLNTLDINNPDIPMTKSETLTAKSGENTLDIGAMDFSGASFAAAPTVENGVLTATISNPSAFFGTTLTTFTTASLTVTTVDGVMTAMTVAYTTTSGSTVTLTVTLA